MVQSSTSRGGVVTHYATERGVLAPGALILIGTFGPKDARGAILRLRSGRTRRVLQGDRIAGAVVARIGVDRIALRRASGEVLLRLPGAG